MKLFSIFFKSFLFLIFIIQNQLIAEQQLPPNFIKLNPTLKGHIRASQDWNKTPQFRILFEGKEVINDEEGFYSFPLETKDSPNKLYLLICKNLNQNFDNINTIKNLSIKIEKPYKYFSIKKTEVEIKPDIGDNQKNNPFNNNSDKSNEKLTQVKNEKKIIWELKEKTLEKKNFISPKNCIVALINPKYVDHVKSWDINLLNNFTPLPQIFLKNNLPEKKVFREAANSLLRSTNMSTFHEKIKTENYEKIINKNMKITLTQ